MFKNLIVYRLGAWPSSAADLEAALQAEPFSPCGASQPKSIGWAPPRGIEHGALVEAIGGQWILRLALETKSVPADAVRRLVDEQALRIENETGRTVGRRERRDMKEDALQQLLPQAFPRRSHLSAWLDPERRWLLIDAASAARADELCSALARASGAGWHLEPLITRTSAQAAMTAWLADEDGDAVPASFVIGQEAELKASGEQPASVRFTRHPLQTEEVRQHIAEGKLPISLALDWQGRVTFTLTEHMQLKKIRFGDGVMDEMGDVPTDERFDADVAIATSELGRLLDELIDALGGEDLRDATGAPINTPGADAGDSAPF